MAETGLLEQDPNVTVDPVQVEPVTPSNQAIASTYEAERRDLDEASETVAGRLEGLLSKESDYIKRAEHKGEEFAHSRGLLNTSMAAGASHAAAIDAALPVAQQDADTSFRQGLENQAAINTALSTGAQLETNVSTANAAVIAEMERVRLSEEAAMSRQQLLVDTDIRNVDAQIEAERIINDDKIEFAEREIFSSTYSELTRQKEIDDLKIMTDPDLSAAEKNRLLDRNEATYQANINLLIDLFDFDFDLDWDVGGTPDGSSPPSDLFDPPIQQPIPEPSPPDDTDAPDYGEDHG